MIGTTISHYKILEKLGEGGMGIVYRAHDTKLDRTVALKFLPSHISPGDAEKERFLQEAKAAAALNHPNICTIYGIEEHNDQQFIEMEVIEGQTLRGSLAEGPLKPDRAIAYAIQLGEALQEAHSKGIVHRDVKPENIMVNANNQIKVTDFGLAKLKGSLKLTRSTSTVGTLSYMAPEQIQGGDVDVRSDLFAFGVVLYEMLTGNSPFRGEHESAIMYSIVNEEPEPLEKHLPAASAELKHIIGRVLEKDPEDRYQSAHDMVIDLRRLRKETSKVSPRAMDSSSIPIATQPQRRSSSVTINLPQVGKRWIPLSALGALVIAAAALIYFVFLPTAESGSKLPIAVADFVNQTAEPELDGLSGMLITSMEQSRRLAVMTRARMFDVLRQSGKTDVEQIDELLGRQICKQAGIHALVTASIRKFGKLYTIDLKVLDPEKDEYLFTAKEEGEGQESIPSMLDRLSEKMRIGLKEKSSEVQNKSERLAAMTTANLEAYQHYFRGEQFIHQIRFQDAFRELEKAVKLDSLFGLAYYRLAYVHNWQLRPARITRPVVDKALSLIDRIPEKERYLLRALGEEIGGNYDKGIEILKAVEDKFPNEKEILYNIGDWSWHDGQYDQAARYLEKVLALDPTFERALQHLTWTYRDQGHRQKMLETANRYAAASKTAEAYVTLAHAFAGAGNSDEGLKTLRQAKNLFPSEPGIRLSIGRLHELSERFDLAEQEGTSMLNRSSPGMMRAGFDLLSSVYIYTGKYRKAIEAMDEGIGLSWKAHDTTGAITRQLAKSLLLTEGMGEADRSRRETEMTTPFLERHSDAYVGGMLSMLAASDPHAELPSIRFAGWAEFLYMLREIEKRNYKRAGMLGDSALGLLAPTVHTFVYYPLASAQYENGKLEEAIRNLSRFQQWHYEDFGGRRGMYYARSFFLLGKIYEKKGEIKLAISNYEKFMDIWKDADPNIPELDAAKTRLSRLRALASK